METHRLMATSQSNQRPPKLKGIRRRRGGWSAQVRANGRLYSKQFPLSTPLSEICAWREGKVDGARAQKEEDALRALSVAYEARRLPCTEKTWCYVYFARSGAIVKIGRSTDPAARLREIQTMHPGDIELLVSVAAHRELEVAIHKRFEHCRTRAKGEWYRLEPDLIAFIRALQGGANPVALLFEDPRVLLGWHLQPTPARVENGLPCPAS